jgi:hypothetical protein
VSSALEAGRAHIVREYFSIFDDQLNKAVSKIECNQPYPRGSGRKYKRCHGGPLSSQNAEASELASAARIGFMRVEARQKEIEGQFGLGRPHHL